VQQFPEVNFIHYYYLDPFCVQQPMQVEETNSLQQLIGEIPSDLLSLS